MTELIDHLENAKQAIVTCGYGRGFIIDTEPRLVVTAAHCLPYAPSPQAISVWLEDAYERAYHDILAPLGAEQCTVWAECRFRDSVADIAVLGPPDSEDLTNHFDAYNDLVESAFPLQIVDPPPCADGWLLGLDGRWGKCIVEHSGGPILLREATSGLVSGMSGSPIVNDEGNAVGVHVTSHGSSPDKRPTEGGPEPRLTHNLPGWVLLEC